MAARHRDFESALGVKLSAYVAAVFAARRLRAAGSFLLDMKRPRRSTAVHEVDDLRDGSERVDFDAAYNCRFPRIPGCDYEARNFLLSSEHGDRENPAYGTQFPVER